jgi:hypothetical protein
MSAKFSPKAAYPLLRLTQTVVGENQYAADVALEMAGQTRQTATSVFTFALSKEDQENIRVAGRAKQDKFCS